MFCLELCKVCVNFDLNMNEQLSKLMENFEKGTSRQ